MDWQQTLIWVVTIALFVAGLAGTLIPFVPGILLIGAGTVWQGVLGTQSLTWWQWLILSILIAGGFITDKVLGGVGAKTFGASKSGVIGAIVGAILGSLFLTPLIGLTIAPFLGALIAELAFARTGIPAAAKAGTGATLGMLSGMALEFLVGLLIISLFLLFYFLI